MEKSDLHVSFCLVVWILALRIKLTDKKYSSIRPSISIIVTGKNSIRNVEEVKFAGLPHQFS